MRLFLKIAFFICLLINLCSCGNKPVEQKDLLTTIKENKVFTVGINENSKPFAYKNAATGKYEGFDIELIQMISKKLFDTDKIIKFVPITPSNRILKLNSKEVDVVISTMTITQERLQVIDFSNPYFMSGQAILVKNNNKIRSGKDLNNKRIGIVLGTTTANNIRYIAPNAQIKGFKNYLDAFNEIENNNIDAISADDVILNGLISNSKKYKILKDRYSTEFYGIALRKDDASQTLKDSINNALAQINSSGKLKKLQNKYNIKNR